MNLSKYKHTIKYLKNRKKNYAGRNNLGRITVAHQGGGHKQQYKQIIFKNFINHNYKNFITTFEYDPNRTSFIFKLCGISNQNFYNNMYKKLHYKYILAPQEIKILDNLEDSFSKKNSSKKIKKQFGNCYFLNELQVGDSIYNIQINNTKNCQFVRSAGTFATILIKTKKFATIKLPSGEVRNIPLIYKAFLGHVSNFLHYKKNLQKAGQSRWLNKRPTVRGVAKNPIDHPHGGNTSGGCHPVTPWARLTKGKPTRSKKLKNKFIITSYKKLK